MRSLRQCGDHDLRPGVRVRLGGSDVESPARHRLQFQAMVWDPSLRFQTSAISSRVNGQKSNRKVFAKCVPDDSSGHACAPLPGRNWSLGCSSSVTTEGLLTRSPFSLRLGRRRTAHGPAVAASGSLIFDRGGQGSQFPANRGAPRRARPTRFHEPLLRKLVLPGIRDLREGQFAELVFLRAQAHR